MIDWLAYVPWREEFAKALDGRFYTLDWLDVEVAQGRVRVWANDKAAIAATMKVYPTGACEVQGLVAGGKLSEIVKLIPEAEAWGRENGAITAHVESHPAWQRLLIRLGYRPIQVALRKIL